MLCTSALLVAATTALAQQPPKFKGTNVFFPFPLRSVALPSHAAPLHYESVFFTPLRAPHHLPFPKFSKGPNMNGDYVISATPNAPKGETFNTKFAEYDSAGVEYFDVYMGPISHR